MASIKTNNPLSPARAVRGEWLTVRQLFAALYAFILIALAVRETTDPDMWWHLRVGEHIWAYGIPRQDIFSYTVPHHAWVAHEWLTQALLWRVYEWGGLPLLALLFALIHAATFLLIYKISPGRPYIAAFVGLLALVASAPLMGVRPQMLTLFLMALFIYLVEQVKNGRFTPRLFWLFPLLTIIWVNLHSGYLLGVVLLAVYVVGEGMQRWLNPTEQTLTWPSIKWLALTAVACLLAAAVNPSGVKIWIYPFETLGSAAMQTYIVEWHSPNFQKIQFWPFLVLVGLGLFAWRISPRKATWSEMLLFGGTAVAGLISARHIPLFAVAAAPIVARHLFYASAAHPRLHGLVTGDNAPQSTTGQKALNGLILLLALFTVFLWVGDKAATNEAAIAEAYPVAAVDYLYENDLAQSRIFNSYGWGGYLIWREMPVFIDGRADVYGDEFIFYYLRTYFGHERWRESLDDFDVEYVLIERSGVLVSLLLDAPEWRQIYEDDLARIFHRQ